MKEANLIIASCTADPLPLSTAAALLAGSFAAEVAAIWSGERRVEYLTAPDARRHVWHAWLAAPANAAAATEASYEHLTHARGRALMSEAYGECPAGLQSALSRLGPTARHRNAYRAIVVVLARGGAAAKYVHHAKDLTDEMLAGLAALPPDAAGHDATVRRLLEPRLSGQAMATFAWALARLRSVHGAAAVDGVLAASKPWDTLWEAHLVFGFPPPPWSVTERLVPLDSFARLRDAGRRLGNCLGREDYPRELVRRVVNGTSYFYEWLGPEPALLMFRRIGPLGWRLEAANGARNEWLSTATRDDIVAELRPIHEVCPVVDMNGVGFALGIADGFYEPDC